LRQNIFNERFLPRWRISSSWAACRPILVVAVVVGVVATGDPVRHQGRRQLHVPGEATLATSGKSVKSLCAPHAVQGVVREDADPGRVQRHGEPQGGVQAVAKTALESVKAAYERSQPSAPTAVRRPHDGERARGLQKLLDDSVDDLKGMIGWPAATSRAPRPLRRPRDVAHGGHTFIDNLRRRITDEKLKADMKLVCATTELSSNALAITNSLGSIFKKLDLTLFKRTRAGAC
ncbi:hypothetical protein EJB05_37638, partial [Eragrostis curvula]